MKPDFYQLRHEMSLMIAASLVDGRRPITDRRGIEEDLRAHFTSEEIWTHMAAAISLAAHRRRQYQALTMKLEAAE